MKIIYKDGDALKGSENYLFHGVNAQGVMGSGIAKQIKLSFKEAFEVYSHAHRLGELRLGTITVFVGKSKVIINGVTQEFYGKSPTRYVSYDAIRSCMKILNQEYAGEEIAMPMVGAGLGGGDWNIIEKIIEEESTEFQPVVYKL